jgi:hypothetical protein
MKVYFLPFHFFFDGLSIKQHDLIDMIVNNVQLQKHRAFEYGINDVSGDVLIGQGITIATEYIIREENFIRVTIDRSKNENSNI